MRLRTRLFTAAAVGGALIAPLAPIGSIAPAGAVSTPELDAAVAWLVDQQEADGGFELADFPGFETSDAVFALASAAQADGTWSTTEAREAVEAVTTSGKDPLDAIDDWVDAVQGGSGSAASKASQAAKVVALVTAPLGLAPTDVDPSGDTATPVDLVAALEAGDGTGGAYADVPIASRAYVLLALATLGETVPAGLIDGIAAAQQDNGGFNFAGDPVGTGFDPDITASVVMGLLAAGRTDADPVVRAALVGLGFQQRWDGEWAGEFDDGNPNSTAVVMLMAVALGSDPAASCWRDRVEPGLTGVPFPSPEAAIVRAQATDGHIASPSDGFGVNTFATSQSIQALAASEGAAFYRFGSPCTDAAVGNPRRLANSLYADVLGRVAEPGGAEFWAGQISAGLRPALIAKRFTGTAEYGRAIASGLYQSYLGRPATADEAQSGAPFIVAGRRFDRAAFILGGQEYFDSTRPSFPEGAPATDETWGAALYEDALGRPQVSGDQAFIDGQLAAGRSREQIARTLLLSAEGRAATVRGLYEDLLRRQPSGSDLTFWGGRLKQGVSPELLVTQFVGSAEYRGLTAA